MYLISLYFDKKHTEILNNYIKTVQEQTKNAYIINRKIPVHLTLATVHECDERMLIAQLNQVIQNTYKGLIDVVAIGTFSKNTIYLTPVCNEFLSTLSFQVNEILDKIDMHREHNRYKPYSWLPHITIARKLNQKELNLAFSSLNQIFEPVTLKITHIALSKSQPYQDIYVWRLKDK